MAYSAAVLLAPLRCMRPTLPDRLLLPPTVSSFFYCHRPLPQTAIPSFRNRRDEIPLRFACTKLKPFIAKMFSGTVNTSDDQSGIFFLALQRHLKLAVPLMLMTVVRSGMLSKLTAITSYAHRERRACVKRERERERESS